MNGALGGRGTLRGRTLLLVDDEPEILQSIALMLRLAGARAILAPSGAEAADLLARHAEAVAAVILDLHLPGEDATRVFDALRARRPELPVILTSGLPEAAARARLGRSEVAGFLPKPFRVEHLVKTLEGALAPLPPAPAPPPPPAPGPESSDPPEIPAGPEAAAGAEPFEAWLLRRVTEAVRRREVPDRLLQRLQAEFDATGTGSADWPRVAAVRKIADLAGIPTEQAAEVLGALERLPALAREPLVRRIAEAWLAQQRERYREPPGAEGLAHVSGPDRRGQGAGTPGGLGPLEGT